jgi:hypothetical protein
MTRDDLYAPNAMTGWEKPALVVGVIGVIALIFGAVTEPLEFFRSYLFGFMFWVAISLGAIVILMIQYLSGGVWGILVRRSHEAAARTIPLMAIAVIPLMLGIHSIYEWSHEEVVAVDQVLQIKSPYLNEPFFIARTVFYFAVWIVISVFLLRMARDYEETLSPATALKMRKLSAGGLVAMAITLTFASVDWMMSLEPHWFSSMFGISFMVASLLGAHALSILVVTSNSKTMPIAAVAQRVHFRDLGNFMLAFVMLWAYTGFSQLLLIWYANMLESIPWYLHRSQGGWLVMASMLLVFHFFLPFFLLLMRPIKDRPRTLAIVALFVLFMRAIDFFWIVKPSFFPTGFHIHWLDFAAFIGIGGIWLAVFFRSLNRRPVVPGYEPYVREALSHA